MRYSLPLFFVRVKGESMLPKYVAGKRYLATSLLSPRMGRTVVARTRHDGLVIKRVTKEAGEMLTLEGTVSWSATFEVHKNDILGVVF
jgi:phage repressor protein C with HTH and peptisase S24 domain